MKILNQGNRGNFSTNHQKRNPVFSGIEIDDSKALSELMPHTHEVHLRKSGNVKYYQAPIESNCRESDIKQFGEQLKKLYADAKEKIKVIFTDIRNLNETGEHILGEVEVDKDGKVLKEPFVGMPATKYGNGEHKPASVVSNACAAIERALGKEDNTKITTESPFLTKTTRIEQKGFVPSSVVRALADQFIDERLEENIKKAIKLAV